jgi:hypothetical protein
MRSRLMVEISFMFLSVFNDEYEWKRSTGPCRREGRSRIRRFHVVFSLKQAGDAVFSIFPCGKRQETMFLAYFGSEYRYNLLILAVSGGELWRKRRFFFGGGRNGAGNGVCGILFRQEKAKMCYSTRSYSGNLLFLQAD